MADKAFIGGLTNTTLHFESDGTLHIEEKQDVEGILDYAAASRNHRFDANACDGMIRHEAEIPWVTYLDECHKRGITSERAMAIFGQQEGDFIIESILANPEYAYLRTAPTLRDPRVIIKGSR
jgi:hypothetical protein